MNGTQPIIVGLGELLWDVFPTGKRLGGAPANFAYHASRLGDRGIIASRVGNDSLGRKALASLGKLGIITRYVQVDREAPTGTVEVQIDESGQPQYVITEDVAWDRLQWTQDWDELACAAAVVCFGSLSQRSNKSHLTVRNFLRKTSSRTLRVFDINLRQTFFSAHIISESLEIADIVKLNHEELVVLSNILGLKRTCEEDMARELLSQYTLKLVCVTRGGDGSLLVSHSNEVRHPGFQVPVKDTVGSGDAFTAALVYEYIRGASLAEISEAANRLGAWVATKVGATPLIENDRLEKWQPKRREIVY